ncbi:hypothetical protein Ddc_17645 [Ditylenchus destructor]|nr:hypothetical protein Ddc_17645 [Ditylenchus destructor]
MNLECQVCTGNKIGTSFYSLDELQAHLFRNHHDGPPDMFQFVCQNCEFKFATEYRHLKHEEICCLHSRSEENMEKIRYKLQMYELLEESLKYNMTRHQTYSVSPANPSNIETSETRESSQTQCQTEWSGAKSIKSELFESRENFVPNLRQENIKRNESGEAAGASPSLITNEPTKNLGNLRTVKAEVQDQNCSKNSATNTQSNVKTEPEDVDTSEVEVLGSVEIRKRKAPSRSAEHISHRSGVSAQQNVNSPGESSNLQQMKLAKINLDESQIPSFNSIRDQEERMSTSTSTVANLTNKSATGLRQTSREEPSVKISGPVRMTNRIHVNGPCLHPEQVNKRAKQKEELRTYFSQFGEITSFENFETCRGQWGFASELSLNKNPNLFSKRTDLFSQNYRLESFLSDLRLSLEGLDDPKTFEKPPSTLRVLVNQGKI